MATKGTHIGYPVHVTSNAISFLETFTNEKKSIDVPIDTVNALFGDEWVWMPRTLN